MAVPKTRDIREARYRERSARLRFPAPIFWATKPDRADMKAIGTMDRKAKSFSAIPTPAEAIRPRVFTIPVIIRKDRLVRKS